SEIGTEAQRDAFLGPMIEGSTSLAFAYAEKQSRYNLNDCATTATKNGDDWALAGEKVWVLNGHAADQIIVVARTGGGQFDDSGLSLFIVDGEAAGLSRIRVPGMDGQRSAVLTLDGVTVGADRLLGREGDALATIEKAVDRGAAAAVAEGYGAAQELFERTVAYLKQREQFGKPIGTFQAVTQRAGDMFIHTQTMELAMLSAAWRLNAEPTAGNLSDDALEALWTARYWATEAGHHVVAAAQHLHGGVGVDREYPVHRYFLYAKQLELTLGGATPQLLKVGRILAAEPA
ncbi:MAG TPA: acyl-CoA dehydrogenase, partial [Planctomycetes bacterium]|nr:acyl-CoA dehydrogenase [Planctomycetota bacterium]